MGPAVRQRDKLTEGCCRRKRTDQSDRPGFRASYTAQGMWAWTHS